MSGFSRTVRDRRVRMLVPRRAGVAQLVEQLIRNQQVTRSSRVAGSNFLKKFHRYEEVRLGPKAVSPQSDPNPFQPSKVCSFSAVSIEPGESGEREL